MLNRVAPDQDRKTEIHASSRGVNLGDLVTSVRGIVRRRLWVLVGVTAGLTIVGLILIAMMTSKYDAVTRIRIDPSRNPMAQDQSQGVLNAEAIETEVGMMTSLDLAREVVRRLRLDRDPEFSVPAQPEGAAEPSDPLNRVARKVMRNVTVGRDRLSYIITLGFKSREADKAALIANTYADAYLDLRVSSQVGTSTRQAEFFKSRLAELAAAVNANDSRLAEYRARAGISENSATGSIADQQIAPLSGQLATAEAEAAAARSNAAVARMQVARGGLDAVSEVRNSSVIGDLRRQRAEILRNKGEVEAQYGPKHPESIRVNDQVTAIDKQIREEAQRVVTSLQGQASAAAAQVQSLRSTLSVLEGQRAQNTRASAQAERLAREAQSARAAYDKMSQLSLESTQGARGALAQAEVVDRARPPSAPTSPNKPLLAILTLVVAFAVGLGTAILLEMAQSGMRSIDELEDRFGLPVLASLPQHGAARRRFGAAPVSSPADGIGADKATMFSESIRNLRASLFGAGLSRETRILAFTSALPSEGKTTTSLSLARMLAVNGTRTLLIDCDLRNSGLRRLTGDQSPAGLVELLSGDVPLSGAAVADKVDGLDVITVRTALFTSQDMFGDGRMSALLERAKQHYQTIVLDLPPVLGVADARSLAALADSTAIVVRWGSTAPRAVELALSALDADRSNVAGMVYAMVDPLSETIGGAYYSRNVGAYYQNA